MKKCPYCYEEIQDEAVKCRFCNEWLDGRNSLPGMLSKTRSTVKQQVSDYISNRNDYKNLPTKETPLKIDTITLFTDKVSLNGELLLFKDLKHILFKDSTNFVGLNTLYPLFFDLVFRKGNELINKTVFWEGSKDSILGKKITDREREKLKIMYTFMSKATFKFRLIYYIEQISKLGYFDYVGGYRIWKNGDISLGDEFKGNIKEASSSGKLDFALRGEPYMFYVYKKAGPFGVSSGQGHSAGKEGIQASFPYSLDSDIFTLFMASFLFTDKEIDPVDLKRDYLTD